jgi:hypothetical protein
LCLSAIAAQAPEKPPTIDELRKPLPICAAAYVHSHDAMTADQQVFVKAFSACHAATSVDRWA